MKYSLLAVGLMTAALLAAPIAGSAQVYNNGNNGYNNGQGQYTGVIAVVDGSALKLEDGRTIFLKNGTVISPTGTHLQVGMQISVTGSPAGNGAVNATEVDIANNGNSNYNNSYNNNDNGQYGGTISSVNGGALRLQDGRTIFLHNGTVINPSGTQLQPGMQISVMGSQAGNGNINASEVDIANNSNNSYNGYNNSNNGYNNGQYGGTISSVNGGALRMQDGRTIFLHNGTVINPTATQLQPGMWISVTGPSAGNGNINANQIDTSNR